MRTRHPSAPRSALDSHGWLAASRKAEVATGHTASAPERSAMSRNRATVLQRTVQQLVGDPPGRGDLGAEVEDHAIAQDVRQRAVGRGVGDQQLERRAAEVQDGAPHDYAIRSRGGGTYRAPTGRPASRSRIHVEPFFQP